MPVTARHITTSKLLLSSSRPARLVGYLSGEIELVDEFGQSLRPSTLVCDLESNSVFIRQGHSLSNTDSQHEGARLESLNELLFCRGRIETQRGLLDRANLVGLPKNIESGQYKIKVQKPP